MQTILADLVKGYAPRSFRTGTGTNKQNHNLSGLQYVSLPLPSLLLKLPDNGYQDRVAV